MGLSADPAKIRCEKGIRLQGTGSVPPKMFAGRDSEGIRTMGEMTALHFEILLQNFVRSGTNSMTRLKGTPVTPRLLQAVLRSFADIGPPVSDAELLRRFI